MSVQADRGKITLFGQMTRAQLDPGRQKLPVLLLSPTAKRSSLLARVCLHLDASKNAEIHSYRSKLDLENEAAI